MGSVSLVEIMEGSNEIPIDIENQHDPLGTSMREQLDRLPNLSSSRCIYRVPRRLREGNEKAYTPQVVSIGPLHHGKDHLVAMEEHKRRYVHDFLRRNAVNLESCIQKVRAQQDRLRDCYAEHIAIESDKFVRLVLVDALFLIEFLLRHASEELQRENDDYIFGTPWIHLDLWSDLVMLENQLPFFILKDLWEVEVRSPGPILWQAYSSFVHRIYLRGVDLERMERLCNSGLEVSHFLDVIRNMCLPEGTNSRGNLQNIPSTTQLHQAGVQFKVRVTHNLLDIHFANGVLEIPELKISDSTEATIRNLVAYEQCHYRQEPYICHYVVLVDGLVNTPKDVELLGKYEILNSMLGDGNQVCTLINNLGNGVIADHNNFYFATICDDLQAYCGTRWNKWKTNLRQNYLNTPWAVISVVAAILLLVLTLSQTISSLYPLVKHQPSSK